MKSAQHAFFFGIYQRTGKTSCVPDNVSGCLYRLYSNDIQELTDAGLICRRPAGNEYTVSDDRWVLEFYYAHKDDSAADLVHAVMTNEQMWGQDLTKIAGLEEFVVNALAVVRAEGVKQAFANAQA